MLLIAGIFLFLFPIYRMIQIFIRRGRSIDIYARRGVRNVRVCAVLGSGGHTTEMVRIIKCLDDCFTPLCLVQADTDKHSAKMAQEHLTNKQYSLKLIPRAREVKQSWSSTIFSTLKAILYAIPIIYEDRPDLLLLNGPGTCIPIVIAALLLQLTTSHDVKIVFIESFCRVERLSMTGKILYHTIADLTLVQWPQLLQTYPRAKYKGKF